MYEALVFLAILSAAMLVGLMTTLLTVMRVIWRQQSDEDAARAFQDFLAKAGTNRVLSTLTVIPIVSSIVIAFTGAPNHAAYVCALVGGGVFLAFFFLWTAAFNLPVYKAVAQWGGEGAPADVRVMISRFHRSNSVRLCGAFATSLLFFLAA
ncbi:DUF1772 domain-containing protein [Kitasatospora viridis]|uniref:Uncharacterized protein DUF1772 n=1 Tax=Kitasatospora viridis TaxID=281105 RepID=A0A561UMA1_9ACTN|nr:DUF1772 domain-containing protein [Kitasatospora viridis]TWG00482.1 uncharacterized protein DUF1772 [Kitasatospora viridis]